jgi:hypothetical protein
MKKILILSLAVVALASCKKDYTCACTETDVDVSAGTTDVYTSEVTIKDVSKKTVESSSECVSYDETYVDEDGDTYTYTVDCTITKK